MAQTNPDGGLRRVQITVALAAEQLRQVDAAARRRGLTRTAWIALAISERLDKEPLV